MFSFKFQLNFTQKLRTFERIYLYGMRVGGSGNPIQKGLEEAASIYMTSMFERFQRNSAGGGDWAPLSKITKDNKGHSTILVDTGTLMSSLDPKQIKLSGLLSASSSSIRIGIAGGQSHPRSDLMVDQLAATHHYGRSPKNNLPARKILVPPSSETLRKMSRAIGAGIKEAARRAGF